MILLSKIIKSEETIPGMRLVELYKDSHTGREIKKEPRKEYRYSETGITCVNAEVERIYDEARQRAAQEAAKLLENAYAKRDKIVNTAEEDVKRIKERAYEEGIAQGMGQASSMVSDTLDGMRRALEQVKSAELQNEEALENELVSLALCMAEKILHKRIEEDPAEMIALAKDVVLMEKDKKNINLHVSSQMMEFADKLDQELEPVRERYQSVIKVKAADLPEGSLRIETSEGIIDASVFVQLDNLREQLRVLYT